MNKEREIRANSKEESPDHNLKSIRTWLGKDEPDQKTYGKISKEMSPNNIESQFQQKDLEGVKNATTEHSLESLKKRLEEGFSFKLVAEAPSDAETSLAKDSKHLESIELNKSQVTSLIDALNIQASKEKFVNISSDTYLPFEDDNMVPLDYAARELGIDDRSVRRIIQKIDVPIEYRVEEVAQEVKKLYVHLPTLVDYREHFGKLGRPKQTHSSEDFLEDNENKLSHRG